MQSTSLSYAGISNRKLRKFVHRWTKVYCASVPAPVPATPLARPADPAAAHAVAARFLEDAFGDRRGGAARDLLLPRVQAWVQAEGFPVHRGHEAEGRAVLARAAETTAAQGLGLFGFSSADTVALLEAWLGHRGAWRALLRRWHPDVQLEVVRVLESQTEEAVARQARHVAQQRRRWLSLGGTFHQSPWKHHLKSKWWHHATC
jgi:hypothetical protein